MSSGDIPGEWHVDLVGETSSFPVSPTRSEVRGTDGSGREIGGSGRETGRSGRGSGSGSPEDLGRSGVRHRSFSSGLRGDFDSGTASVEVSDGVGDAEDFISHPTPPDLDGGDSSSDKVFGGSHPSASSQGK